MLISALAAGRDVSLPSQSAASGAYAAGDRRLCPRLPPVRPADHRFRGRAGAARADRGHDYLLDAARTLTFAGLDQGHHLAVVASIVKLHATDRTRQTVNDAMDVHRGKAIIEGSNDYLGDSYRAIPVVITVEGATILTRRLVVFGQGAIRAHPYLLHPTATRDRLTRNVYVGGGQAVAKLLAAFDEVIATQPLRDRLRRTGVKDWRKGSVGLLTAREKAALEAADRATAEVSRSTISRPRS
ncbi:hypothetical protein [Sphingomonas sp.]|uniref:hypothetical protein n=1 Tax=Sphingomonas sp. TaxID=28214 RepID=UPI003AFFB779